MRVFLLIATVAAAMYAQDAPSFDPSKPSLLIQGVVVDQDSRAPVAGARIVISGTSFPSPSTPIVIAAGATSGASGDFQIRVNSSDNLNLSVLAAHYQSGQASARGIAAGQAAVFIEIPLIHLQTLSGALVDDGTRQPIAGLQVEILAAHADLMGLSIGVQGTRAISGSDGRFVFAELPRGEYFVRISDNPAPAIGRIPAKALVGDSRDKALEPAEGAASYGTVVWPGKNADVPDAPGVTIRATAADLGEIRLTRSKLVNLSGLVAPCEEGSSIQINLSRPLAASARGLVATQDITCGDGFQLLNLPDGSFTVAGIQGFPQRRWASQTIDARSRSPLRLTLNAFVAVQISVEVEGAPSDAPPPPVRFTLDPLNQAVKVDAPASLASGAYEATLYPGERYDLTAQPGPKYYLKRLVYDGSSLPDVSGFMASTAPVSQLRAVLGNAAGIVVQLTEAGNQPKGRVPLALLRDGMSFAEFRKQMLVARDPSAPITFGGLAPGTYRAVRTDPNQVQPATEAQFQAMLADSSRLSSRVTVDEGQTATIAWDLP